MAKRQAKSQSGDLDRKHRQQYGDLDRKHRQQYGMFMQAMRVKTRAATAHAIDDESGITPMEGDQHPKTPNGEWGGAIKAMLITFGLMVLMMLGMCATMPKAPEAQAPETASSVRLDLPALENGESVAVPASATVAYTNTGPQATLSL